MDRFFYGLIFININAGRDVMHYVSTIVSV